MGMHSTDMHMTFERRPQQQYHAPWEAHPINKANYQAFSAEPTTPVQNTTYTITTPTDDYNTITMAKTPYDNYDNLQPKKSTEAPKQPIASELDVDKKAITQRASSSIPEVPRPQNVDEIASQIASSFMSLSGKATVPIVSPMTRKNMQPPSSFKASSTPQRYIQTPVRTHTTHEVKTTTPSSLTMRKTLSNNNELSAMKTVTRDCLVDIQEEMAQISTRLHQLDRNIQDGNGVAFNSHVKAAAVDTRMSHVNKSLTGEIKSLEKRCEKFCEGVNDHIVDVSGKIAKTNSSVLTQRNEMDKIKAELSVHAAYISSQKSLNTNNNTEKRIAELEARASIQKRESEQYSNNLKATDKRVSELQKHSDHYTNNLKATDKRVSEL
jgi:uncharacterized coiled-coil protein SlyX/ribosomal protein S20